MSDPTVERYKKRHTALRTERDPYWKEWRILSEWLNIRQGRYLVTERGKRQTRSNIINDTGQYASKVQAAGMMAGVTSPARPWFKLKTPDDRLNERRRVKEWLALVEQRMRDVFRRSNVYNSLHELYGEQGGFGTACCLLLPNPRTVVHAYTQTAGMYALAIGPERRVDTMYREDMLTCEQIVRGFARRNARSGSFDMANLSTEVRSAWLQGNKDQTFPITHAVEPRVDREADSPAAINKPVRSVYYEQNGDNQTTLRRGGFDRFPVLAPRWHLLGNDVYGTGPGHDAVGAVRALQNQERRHAQGIDRSSNPPMTAPGNLRNKQTTTLPGQVTYLANPQDRFEAAYLLRPDIAALGNDMARVEQRIMRAFMADLFLMMISDPRVQPATATEIAERHEEKLLMLGPVLERQNNELLDPLIDITFDYMWDAELIPPPPEELQLVPLEVEYVSILHQAQRAVGTATIDRFTSYTQAVMATHPEAGLKFNAPNAIDAYGDALGVPPGIVVPDDDYAKLLAERRRAEAAQYAQEQANQAAGTAAMLANAPGATNESTLLQDVTGGTFQ